MKKIFLMLLIIIVTILLLFLCWILFVKNAKKEISNQSETMLVGIPGCLIVNDVQICNDQVTVYPNDAEVPLVATLEALGYKVTPVDQNISCVTSDNRTFTLDFNAITLTENGGDGTNLLLSPPGNSYFCRKKTNSDVIIDVTTFNAVVGLMGTKVYCTIDYERAIVIVDMQ